LKQGLSATEEGWVDSNWQIKSKRKQNFRARGLRHEEEESATRFPP
jgi:hypothetical protein